MLARELFQIALRHGGLSLVRLLVKAFDFPIFRNGAICTSISETTTQTNQFHNVIKSQQEFYVLESSTARSVRCVSFSVVSLPSHVCMFQPCNFLFLCVNIFVAHCCCCCCCCLATFLDAFSTRTFIEFDFIPYHLVPQTDSIITQNFIDVSSYHFTMWN